MIDFSENKSVYNKVEPQDLISVIVPFLNGGPWLLEALESVLQQTYKHWELIVIDDGSEPQHSAMAKEFCAQYPGKIFYTEHEGHVNKGVTISRNEAVKLARGKYLAFLDADDKWKSGKLERQLSCFATHPEARVICNAFISWYSWQNNDDEDIIQLLGAPAGKIYQPGTLIKISYPFYPVTSPPPSGIIITKKAYDRVGGFEPVFSGIYELYEDQAFLSKIYLNEVVYISDAADIIYRKRPDSMSSAADNTERYHTVRTFYFNWLEQYLQEHNFKDPDIECLIKTARNEMQSTLI